MTISVVFAIVVGLATVAPAWGQEATPQTPITIRTGEVYLYGHKIEPPYVLAIVDSVLTINAVPVFPPQQLPVSSSPATAQAELAAERQALLVQASDLEIQMKTAGESDDQKIAESAAAMIRGATALVDSVTSVTALSFRIWWHGGSQEVYLTVLGCRGGSQGTMLSSFLAM